MFRLLVVACLAYVTVSLPFTAEPDGEWIDFKLTYNKAYSQGEDVHRHQVWEENVKYIEEHNLEAASGTKTFWVGVNEYADMTVTEFVHVMNGYKQSLRANTVSQCGHYMAPNNVQLADFWNWTAEGYVTDIKNQGKCGSGWAFSATGSLEGQHFKKTGQLVPLAESNLVDCSQAEGNDGCNGGLMDQAFTYIIKNDGIDTESSYTYEPMKHSCAFKSADVGATAVSCMDIDQFSESDLQKAVATVGPISVAIDASHI